MVDEVWLCRGVAAPQVRRVDRRADQMDKANSQPLNASDPARAAQNWPSGDEFDGRCTVGGGLIREQAA